MTHFPSAGLVRAFLALWLFTGVHLLVVSGVTAVNTASAGIALLASVETLAAALFLVPRFVRVGAVGLVATLAIAFLAHVAKGELRGELIIYGASAVFVAVHGPLGAGVLDSAIRVRRQS